MKKSKAEEFLIAQLRELGIFVLAMIFILTCPFLFVLFFEAASQ